MKIKRFFSQDMRSAIRLVREELGADAVILSNDRVNGGVEIVAAVDYDEAILEPSAASTERHFSQAEPNSNSHSNKAVGAEQARRNNPHATVNSNARNSQRNNQRAAENDRGSNNTARQAPAQSASRVNQHPSRTESHKTQRAADYASTAKQSGFEDFSDELLNDEEFLDADEYLADIGTGDTGTGNIEAGEIGEYGNQHLNSSLHNRIESAFKPAAKKESPYLRNQNDHQTNASAEFYTLDEALPEEVKVNDTLYDTEQAQKFPHELVNGKNADGDGSYSVWSQEPTLVAMRNEITNLRGMLEQQLTGLAWNDLKKNNPLRAKLIKQLLELGFGPELANQVIQSSEGQSDDYRKAWQMTLSSLAEKLPIQDDDVALSGGVVALVGATGVGKTTTIAKLAARYALRHGRNSIVLITT
ncbi:MAG: hypothetical protein PVJ72_11710, partial [Gammaproteobacteria bacterium]